MLLLCLFFFCESLMKSSQNLLTFICRSFHRSALLFTSFHVFSEYEWNKFFNRKSGFCRLHQKQFVKFLRNFYLQVKSPPFMLLLYAIFISAPFWFQTRPWMWPAPCQVDSAKNKKILRNIQKQSVQIVQAAVFLLMKCGIPSQWGAKRRTEKGYRGKISQ